jgi:hypothetical protein
MNKRVEFLKLMLLLGALVLPVPVIGYGIHTPRSITVAFLGLIIIGLVVPFCWFLVQKKGYGQELGGYRSAAHLVVWTALVPPLTCLLWYHLPQLEMLWKQVGVGLTAAVLVALALYLTVVVWLDHALVRLYAKLLKSGHDFLRWWLTLCFFIGTIPTMTIISLFSLYAAGRTGIDPVSGAYILMNCMWYVLYIKIFLAMMSMGVYLFFALEGSKGYRGTVVMFTAVFWLILMFIPFIISIRLPSQGLWRLYADPSYFSMYPVISEMWTTALALLGGLKVSDWIFSLKR